MLFAVEEVSPRVLQFREARRQCRSGNRVFSHSSLLCSFVGFFLFIGRLLGVGFFMVGRLSFVGFIFVGRALVGRLLREVGFSLVGRPLLGFLIVRLFVGFLKAVMSGLRIGAGVCLEAATFVGAQQQARPSDRRRVRGPVRWSEQASVRQQLALV